MPNFISEDQIEEALVQKLQRLHGLDSLNCHRAEAADLNAGAGRTSKRDVILQDRVLAAAPRLNPKIPAKTIDDALERCNGPAAVDGFDYRESDIAVPPFCRPSFPVDQFPLGQPQQERGIIATFLGAHRRHAFVIPNECRQLEKR